MNLKTNKHYDNRYDVAFFKYGDFSFAPSYQVNKSLLVRYLQVSQSFIRVRSNIVEWYSDTNGLRAKDILHAVSFETSSNLRVIEKDKPFLSLKNSVATFLVGWHQTFLQLKRNEFSLPFPNFLFLYNNCVQVYIFLLIRNYRSCISWQYVFDSRLMLTRTLLN